MTTLLEFAQSMSRPAPRMGRPPGNPPPRIDWQDPEQKRAYKAAQQRERQDRLIAEKIAAGVNTCNRCDIEKPFDQFEPDPRKRLGIRGICRECLNAARQKRYHESADHERARSRQAAQAIRDQAIAVYGGQCEGCGETRGLQFDHVDWNGGEHRKVEDASTMKRRIATTGQRLTDYRLQLLCRPCHQARRPTWTGRALALAVARANDWPVL